MTAPDYQAIATVNGYRVAENRVVNAGFYWRPYDDLSFSPVAVFPTEPEAWRHCCEFNELIKPDPSIITVRTSPNGSDGPFILCVHGPRGGILLIRGISAEQVESLYQQLAAMRKEKS